MSLQVQPASAHLSRRFRFSASHRLHVDHLTDERNRELFGKCNHPFGHGHNYVAQITVAGPVDPETGMVVNLADMDAFAQSELYDRFDCANLNEDAGLAKCVPSTENLCVELWRVFARFAAKYPGLRLRRVRIEETANNAFDYFGDGSPVPSID